MLKELWDRYAALGYENIYQARIVKDHLEKLTTLFLPSNGICLDIGCGTGNLFEPIVQKIRPRVIYSVDWSEEMLKKAEAEAKRLTHGTHFEIQRNDLSKTPWNYPDQYFDAIVSNLFITYLPCGWRVPLKEMERVLKSGGYLYLGTLLKSWGFTKVILTRAPIEFLKSPPSSFKELTQLKYQRIISKIDRKVKKEGAEFPTITELIEFLNNGFEEVTAIPTYWKKGVALRARRK